VGFTGYPINFVIPGVIGMACRKSLLRHKIREIKAMLELGVIADDLTGGRYRAIISDR